MCAQSVQALTVRMHDIGVAGATVTARGAAAEFDMLSQFAVGELKQFEREHKLLLELAEQGAPISLVPTSVP